MFIGNLAPDGSIFGISGREAECDVLPYSETLAIMQAMDACTSSEGRSISGNKKRSSNAPWPRIFQTAERVLELKLPARHYSRLVEIT